MIRAQRRKYLREQDIGFTGGCSGKFFTFGTKDNQPLSTPITSRTRYRKSTDLSTDIITVSGGTYQLKVEGVWQEATAAPGTWGTATAIRLIGTSAAVYYPDPDSDVSVTGTIDGVADVFTIVTMSMIFDTFIVDSEGNFIVDIGGDNLVGD
jgi:hypothetical protein